MSIKGWLSKLKRCKSKPIDEIDDPPHEEVNVEVKTPIVINELEVETGA